MKDHEKKERPRLAGRGTFKSDVQLQGRPCHPTPATGPCTGLFGATCPGAAEQRPCGYAVAWAMHAAAAESAAAAERGEFARCMIGVAGWSRGPVPLLIGPVRRCGRNRWAVLVNDSCLRITTNQLAEGPYAWRKRNADLFFWGLSACPRAVRDTWDSFLTMVLLPQADAWERAWRKRMGGAS